MAIHRFGRRCSLLLPFSAVAISGCSLIPRAGAPAVTGSIVHDSTGEALPDVLLIVEQGSEAWADERGDFALHGLTPGRYRVLVVGYGCRTAEGELTAVGGSAEPVRIAVDMPPPVHRPGDVEPSGEDRGRVVTAREIAGMGAARLSDVVRRVAPEMIGAPTGDPGRASALRGRGSPSTSGPRVPVLVVDGVVIHATDASALDQVALNDVAWLEIVAGAAAGWQYGTGGSGGIVRIHTKRGYRPSQDTSPEYCPLPDGWGPEIQSGSTPGSTPNASSSRV